MDDAFITLGLPPHAALSEEQVRAAYFALTKAGPAGAGDLNAAYQLLLAPEQRLKHLLTLAAPPEAQAWRTVPMSEALMQHFLTLGRLRPSAEALITKREAASSALAKALLEQPTLALRDQLEELGFAIEGARSWLEQTLPELDAALSKGEPHAWQSIAIAQAQFSYLSKWQAQLRELLLKLM
jgi:hypothetical protein